MCVCVCVCVYIYIYFIIVIFYIIITVIIAGKQLVYIKIWLPTFIFEELNKTFKKLLYTKKLYFFMGIFMFSFTSAQWLDNVQPVQSLSLITEIHECLRGNRVSKTSQRKLKTSTLALERNLQWVTMSAISQRDLPCFVYDDRCSVCHKIAVLSRNLF